MVKDVLVLLEPIEGIIVTEEQLEYIEKAIELRRAKMAVTETKNRYWKWLDDGRPTMGASITR